MYSIILHRDLKLLICRLTHFTLSPSKPQIAWWHAHYHLWTFQISQV